MKRSQPRSDPSRGPAKRTGGRGPAPLDRDRPRRPPATTTGAAQPPRRTDPRRTAAPGPDPRRADPRRSRTAPPAGRGRPSGPSGPSGPRPGPRPGRVRPAPAPARRPRTNSAQGERAQKLLSERGVASRRHGEQLIVAGRVTSAGRAVHLGERVAPDAPLEVDGRKIEGAVAHRYVLLNKPVGVVSTARDDRGRATVVSLVGARERLYPVGRLDADSEGLLLLTNDGAWAERVLHPRFGHEREYEVEVIPEPSTAQLTQLKRGVALEEGLARFEALRVSAPGRLRLVLHTGWKRQVRRMCAVVGLRVVRLRRVRVGPLDIGKLPAGKWRELTQQEVRALRAARR